MIAVLTIYIYTTCSCRLQSYPSKYATMTTSLFWKYVDASEEVSSDPDMCYTV